MIQASAYIIQTKIPDYSWLGIVSFETISYTLKDMTQVKSQQDRDNLISALPRSTLISTCIGCGITTALQVYLKTHFKMSIVLDGLIILRFVTCVKI
jgi:hypothetical protein